MELTSTAAHPWHKLIATASKVSLSPTFYIITLSTVSYRVNNYKYNMQ